MTEGEITRHHQCQCIEGLARLAMASLHEHGRFTIEGRVYQRLNAAA